ncbi:hypothetical protein D3C73_1311110 [compost metagenome]
MVLHVLRTEANNPAHQHGTDAGQLGNLGNTVHVVIHIQEGGGAAFQHFQYRQGSPPIDIVSGELFFHRPHFFLQPVLKHHVIPVAAQQGHCCMAMGIDQTRHEQQTAAVNGLGTFFNDRFNFSYVCDEIIFYGHITA